jgi:hypothetical protein
MSCIKRAIVVYHKVDYDGLFSCALVNDWLTLSNTYISWDLLGYDYSDESIPDYSEWGDTYDTLIMVDVSFPPEDMLKLRESMEEFIYEDHHAVSIDNSIEYGYSDLYGIRTTDRSAAYNTWMDLFPDNEVPVIIKFISDLDTWKKDEYNWEEELIPFNYAFETEFGLSIASIKTRMNSLCNMSLEDLKEKYIEKGKLIKKFVDRKFKNSTNKYSFEVTVDSKYLGIAILGTDFTATIFKSVYQDYDFFLIANRVDDTRYKISLYGKQEESHDFSCGEYCKKFGGGGHKTAASCIVGIDTFIKLIKDKEF